MGVRVQGHALYIMIYAFCQCLPLYAPLSALSLRSDESLMRADLLLSTPISRLSRFWLSTENDCGDGNGEFNLFRFYVLAPIAQLLLRRRIYGEAECFQ